jgi:hypothetical protein
LESLCSCYCDFRLFIRYLWLRLNFWELLLFLLLGDFDRDIETRGWSAYGKGTERLRDWGGNAGGRHHWEVNVAHIDRE